MSRCSCCGCSGSGQRGGIQVDARWNAATGRPNAALYRIAVTRLRCDPRTRDYLNRRTSQGKSHHEAIRRIKRYIAGEVHSLIRNGPTLATAESVSRSPPDEQRGIRPARVSG